MDTEVQQHNVAKEARREDKPNRHDRVRQQISLNHKGVRTGIAAGLLALVGLSAWLLA
ncbi:hypothetical protein [Pseudoduganella violaceinigra]|uniref:hypothetical protein n=1 Tax=Pseudoduganella violaceinigra TaxID=246602 RepID=UPI0004177603|nr:hypothetical protein [Pseudoduganella violaceinigra]